MAGAASPALGHGAGISFQRCMPLMKPDRQPWPSAPEQPHPSAKLSGVNQDFRWQAPRGAPPSQVGAPPAPAQ